MQNLFVNTKLKNNHCQFGISPSYIQKRRRTTAIRHQGSPQAYLLDGVVLRYA